MSERERPIAIIGAGFSGTMTALHLLERIRTRPILLCERGPTFARGPAYSTDDPVHLLNVRAENMSAFSDRPDHFIRWLGNRTDLSHGHVHETEIGTFVSRSVYGRYLGDLIQQALGGDQGAARLRIVPDEVLALERRDRDGFRLRLAGGRTYEIAAAVLAVGTPTAPTRGGVLVRDPWGGGFTDDLEPGLPVVVVGSGLSMVDVVSSLAAADFPGPVVSISRRGLLPRCHAASAAWRFRAFDPLRPSPLSRRLQAFRREVSAAAADGITWHGVVDAVRPDTVTAWRGLDAAAQARFLRHLRPWWDVHRHRLPPPTGRQLERLVGSGYLQVEAGQILGIEESDRTASVTWMPRGRTTPRRIDAQRVVMATGSPPIVRTEDPLLSSLIAAGDARIDTHGLGLDLTDDLALRRRDGSGHERIWAIGPIARGVFWECTAVPDIRRNAETLAGIVAGRLAGQAL